MKSAPPVFTVARVRARAHGFSYWTFLVSGWLNGRRIRRHFKDPREAEGERASLEVQAANASEIRARNTRLSADQLAEAEAAFTRLGQKSLSAAVEWYLTTYRPPVSETALEQAIPAFLAARRPHVRHTTAEDYRRTLGLLTAAFPGREVHRIGTADIQRFLEGRGIGPKRFNNLRGDLSAFFTYCAGAPRAWCVGNPVLPIAKFRISRGTPKIISAQQAAALMAYVEAYAGAARSELPPGCLVPYFALCLFAGLRPSVHYGEVWKIGQLPDPEKVVDLELGAIRIEPEIAKTKSVRRVTIQPNLAAWLMRYPLKKFPVLPPNSAAMISEIRKKFALTDDVLRHTYISMHVAKFRSMGAAALEAGNSEAMIRRHYLDAVSAAEAERFWSIGPGGAQLAPVIAIGS